MWLLLIVNKPGAIYLSILCIYHLPVCVSLHVFVRLSVGRPACLPAFLCLPGYQYQLAMKTSP